MTVSEALINKSPYPISAVFIETVGIDRDLTLTSEYTKVIGSSQSYELAFADVLVYLHDSPSIVEQSVSISSLVTIKKELLSRANAIYKEYDDPKYTGKGTYGFIGENFND